MNKTKVFVISLHKTGTTSMAHFLERLGYVVTVAEPHLFHEVVEGRYEKIDIFLKKYDAFQDDPWYFVYPYVYKKYPDAKFIFLERKESQWLRSVQYFYGKDKYNEKVRNAFYGSADSINNPDLYLKKYREHKKEVFDFFRNKENFIAVSISKPTDAERLQTFLGKKVRFHHFPHYKKRTESGKEKVQLKLKHFLASAFGLNRYVKKFLIHRIGSENFIQNRNKIRLYRAKWRVKRKKYLKF